MRSVHRPPREERFGGLPGALAEHPRRRSVNRLLAEVARTHPQGLIYPLTVASKSLLLPRRTAALRVLTEVRKANDTLVEQAALVSTELIRCSILWHEVWHAALEEASRLYFQASDVDGMLAALAPLHAQISRGPVTTEENDFLRTYGAELRAAHEHCERYRLGGRSRQELQSAWELYSTVFGWLTKQIGRMTSIELAHASPRLLQARDLELAVPGTYEATAPVVRIGSFARSMSVIGSKQRPRKLSVYGDDGSLHDFLLKGHEDLRQDERVMQLFGLVNALLASTDDGARLDLGIQRYSVVPLSPNSGLISWVAACDTLHALIKAYRDGRKAMPLNVEHRLMVQLAPDYDQLPLLNKLEAFDHAPRTSCEPRTAHRSAPAASRPSSTPSRRRRATMWRACSGSRRATPRTGCSAAQTTRVHSPSCPWLATSSGSATGTPPT